MISKRSDMELIESFFTLLNDRGIDYGIMRNAQEVAEGDAHDIDMCIRDSRMQEAETLLNKQAERLGWKLHLKTGSSSDLSNIKCYNYHYVDKDTQRIYIVHIDIFPTFAWKGYELLSNDILLEEVQGNSLYHRIAPEAEAVCNLFVRLLYNGKIKDKYKPSILQIFQNSKEKVCELMQQFLSPELAESIYNYTIEQQWDIIDQKRREIVRNVKRKAKRKHFTYISYLLSKALNRKGLIVAFQGTDGSGKTTIINGIENVLTNTFSNNTLNYYHWRPGFIKSEKRLDTEGNVVSNVQPHTHPPYGTALSLVKMCLYAADYILGYWMKVYWQAAQGHLVVFDRYYYDFYMDKARYRLKLPDSLIRIFHPFIPKPDITFVLLGNAEQIHARKNELPLGEVRKQISTLKKYKESFASPVVIDVCRPIRQVVHDVALNILNKLVNRGLHR